MTNRAGTGELFLRALWARAYVRVVAGNRELSWIVFEAVLPILSTAAYVFIYRAIGAPPAYTAFAVLGGAMTAYWLNVLWSMASQLFWEKQSGNLEAYLTAPAPLMGVLTGMAVGGMAYATVRAAAVVAGALLLFRVPLAVKDPAGLAGAFLLTLSALYGLGMMLASVYLLYGREAWHVSNLLQEPVYLLSGLYFPVRALGLWVAALAGVIPLTLGLDAMRQSLYGPEQSVAAFSLGAELVALAGLTVAFAMGAWAALRAMLHLARREGRLTLRWE